MFIYYWECFSREERNECCRREGRIVVIKQMKGGHVYCTDWGLASPKLICSNRRENG